MSILLSHVKITKWWVDGMTNTRTRMQLLIVPTHTLLCRKSNQDLEYKITTRSNRTTYFKPMSTTTGTDYRLITLMTRKSNKDWSSKVKNTKKRIVKEERKRDKLGQKLSRKNSLAANKKRKESVMAHTKQPTFKTIMGNLQWLIKKVSIN
jgi:hypothetical protein